MATIEVRTQGELDAALKKAGKYDLIACIGNGYFEVKGSTGAYGSASVTAYGSASVRAYGSASVTASGSASVRAYDSASVRAYGSASVTASGSASVRAYGSASVTASKYVSVHVDRRNHLTRPKITGGVLIEVPLITTAQEWCDLHGLEIVDGLVTLYKAVDDDYATERGRRLGISYAPGATPAAPDWDPKPECGKGLHFSPRPDAALIFNPDAKRYVGCPVALTDIVVHSPAEYPDKVKAPRVTGPCFEVDIDGKPVAAAAGKPAVKRTRKVAA